MSQRRSVRTVSSNALSPGVIGYAMPSFSFSSRVEIGHGLHDPRGGHERALLTVHELRERLRLLMVTQVHLLLVGELVPECRAEDRDEAVVDLLRILGIEVLRPVDARGGVPLLLLALVVERQERGALVFVLPGERCLGLTRERPAGLVHGQLVTVHGRHGGPPEGSRKSTTSRTSTSQLTLSRRTP